LDKPAAVTWLLDRAFDDKAIWGVIWQQEDRLVVRLQHLDRLIQAPDRAGRWRKTKVEPCRNAKPGKIILTRGLRRLLDMFAARSILEDYLHQHGSLPPQVAAFLPDDFFERRYVQLSVLGVDIE
jgi:hypothetical protein